MLSKIDDILIDFILNEFYRIWRIFLLKKEYSNLFSLVLETSKLPQCQIDTGNWEDVLNSIHASVISQIPWIN